MTEFVRTKDTLLDRFGRLLAGRLRRTTSGYMPYTPSDPNAIKYLTQSTWSHAAMFIGPALPLSEEQRQMPMLERPQLIEVNLGEGCVMASLGKYSTYNTRVCRPVGLTPDDRETVIRFMVSRLGLKYDLKNIFDMLRYFLPTPPVPVRWHRRMLAFGSGDPTRAICSSLIAQAFELIRYPILPDMNPTPDHARALSSYSKEEILHIRHHSLFTPRDFDLSPYFRVVKPTLEYGFDYKRLKWEQVEERTQDLS